MRGIERTGKAVSDCPIQVQPVRRTHEPAKACLGHLGEENNLEHAKEDTEGKWLNVKGKSSSIGLNV